MEGTDGRDNGPERHDAAVAGATELGSACPPCAPEVEGGGACRRNRQRGSDRNRGKEKGGEEGEEDGRGRLGGAAHRQAGNAHASSAEGVPAPPDAAQQSSSIEGRVACIQQRHAALQRRLRALGLGDLATEHEETCSTCSTFSSLFYVPSPSECCEVCRCSCTAGGICACPCVWPRS